MESYILTRTMHFGFLKESFGKGAVIQYEPEASRVVIDGRKFEDYRDIEILKKQALKKPHDPWIIPYGQEARAELLAGEDDTCPVVPKNEDGKMPIVQSDVDSHEFIDISHTKISKIANEAKEAERNRAKSGELPVIKGDESVEERVAKLKGAKTTDLGARAERVRLMNSKKAKMEIIHDDSLGSVGGSRSAALNAGLPVSGKRAEESDGEYLSKADARKAEIARNREKIAAEMGVDLDAAGVDETTPVPVVVQENAEPVVEHVEMSSKDAEIDELKARLARFEEGVDAPRKARRMPVVAKES